MSSWLRIKAEPRFCGPLSVGTVEPMRILRDQLNLSLADAKAAIDSAVFEGLSVRILVASDEQARLLAGALASSAPGIVTAWVEPQARVDDLVLIIPSKADEERDAVAAAWELAGGTVTRVDRFWDPPPIARDRARPYGPDTFALVLAEKLGLEFAEPDPNHG